MLKEDCIHRLAWSSVSPGAGAKTDTVEANGIITTRISGADSGGMEALLARHFEQLLAFECANLPEKLDLNGKDLETLEGILRNHYQESRKSTIIPGLAESLSAQEEVMISKLRELANEERQDS